MQMKCSLGRRVCRVWKPAWEIQKWSINSYTSGVPNSDAFGIYN